MKFRRFQKLVAAYGGDPSRWPADERRDAARLLDASASARRLVETTRRLDQGLDSWAVGPAEPALRQTILDVSNQPVVSTAPGKHPRRSRIWAPAAALAVAGLFGFAVGLTNVLPETGTPVGAGSATLVYGLSTIDEVMP